MNAKRNMKQAKAQYDATCAAALTEYKQLSEETRQQSSSTIAFSMADRTLWREYMDKLWDATRTLKTQVPGWFY